jgi:hypothetical protein
MTAVCFLLVQAAMWGSEPARSIIDDGTSIILPDAINAPSKIKETLVKVGDANYFRYFLHLDIADAKPLNKDRIRVIIYAEMTSGRYAYLDRRIEISGDPSLFLIDVPVITSTVTIGLYWEGTEHKRADLSQMVYLLPEITAHKNVTKPGPAPTGETSRPQVTLPADP